MSARRRKHIFLVRLDDAIGPLDDPEQITETAARTLGRHLHVDRCAYADVAPDEDTMYITGNYRRVSNVKSLIGKWKFSGFGSEMLNA